MIAVESKVPALRFPEFEGHWEEKKLGEISDVRTGPFGSVLHQHDYVQFGTPIITVEHLSDHGIVHQNLPLVSDKDKHRLKAYILSEGDIVFSRVGSVDRNSLISSKENGWLFSGRLLRVRVKNDEYNPKFLSICLQRKESKEKILSVAVGQTMPSINTEILKGIKLSFPILPEQQKIGAFLTAVDAKIELLTKKKTLLEQYKKGVMQQIFNQQIRFKDDNGEDFPEWEEKQFKGIASFFSGGTPASTNKDFYNGDIPFIKSGEINSSYTEQFLSKEGLVNSSAKMVNEGDLLYALYGATSGQVAISKINGAINQAVLCIRSSHCDTYFLYSYLSHKKENILSTYLQGGQGNLSAEIIKSLKVPVPSFEEQQKIATFLSSIDQKITDINKHLEYTKTYKKGLLQQLFV